MLDLFAIAAKNADSIDNAFNDAVTSLPVDEAKTATEFAQWVDENTLISINIRLFVIAELLCGIPYRNIHEWAEEQADLSGKA